MSINQNFPEVSPSLLLDFANSRTLDPRITFTRSSIGTYVASNGLIKTAAADEPRFDHDPETGESLGLLIEESRTNLLTYSEQFDQWTVGTNTTVTPNAVTAPDGTLTADRVFNRATGNTFVGNGTITVGTTYTVSVYAKAVTPGTNDKFTLNVGGTINNVSSQFTATAEWQRFTFTITPSITSPAPDNKLYINNEGDGFASDIYVWGAQVEQGSFPTSYIPTSGSTITRQSDKASITGSNFTDFYNQTKGTVFVEYDGGRLTNFPVGYGRLATTESWSMEHGNSGTGRYFGVTGGAYNSFTALVDTYTNFSKYAISIENSTYVSAASDGILETSITGTVTYSTTATKMNIGSSPVNTYQPNGHIKQLLYYPQRLTDSQLQNLTK